MSLITRGLGSNTLIVRGLDGILLNREVIYLSSSIKRCLPFISLMTLEIGLFSILNQVTALQSTMSIPEIINMTSSIQKTISLESNFDSIVPKTLDMVSSIKKIVFLTSFLDLEQ